MLHCESTLLTQGGFLIFGPSLIRIMDPNQLRNLFRPEPYREQSQQLLELVAQYLKDCAQQNHSRTIPYCEPAEQYDFWKDFQWESDQPVAFFQKVIDRINHLHDPRNLGHQVAPPLPLAAMAAGLGAQLNNGNAIYEMGMPVAVMERWVCEQMAEEFGFPKEARGFLTSGGTLANLTALLAARKEILPYDVWNDGSKELLGVMVSSQAHYCIDRAVRIMGMGGRGIVSVPVKEDFTLDVSQLESSYNRALEKGIRVFAIVGSAPSTSTGNFDDFRALGSFARAKGIWFHIDGAHGGSAVLSQKYQGLLDGVEFADSIIIDGHKMMLMPALTTMLLFRSGEHSHRTFRQQADYLFDEGQDEDWYNLAKRTFECTKTMMGLQWYLLFKSYGKELFDAYITRQFDLAREFARLITAREHWETATEPMSNIVCFRYLPPRIPPQEHSNFQKWLRRKALEDGTYYIVETRLNGHTYLRATLMSPFTEIHHLEEMLGYCERLSEKWVPRPVSGG